eukprot:664502-Pelagomonas_calceolata.AAC.7
MSAQKSSKPKAHESNEPQVGTATSDAEPVCSGPALEALRDQHGGMRAGEEVQNGTIRLVGRAGASKGHSRSLAGWPVDGPSPAMSLQPLFRLCIFKSDKLSCELMELAVCACVYARASPLFLLTSDNTLLATIMPSIP